MTSLLTPSDAIHTLADLVERLGGIPLDRIRFHPAPGTATEQDVIDLDAHEDRLCELVDGVLVEKPKGLRESLLACALIEVLGPFIRARNLGVITGEAGMMRLFPGLVRIPDVAFAHWDRLPNRRMPAVSVPAVVPDLVVEVLSPSNTEAEMARKRQEYFGAGVRLVWMVDPDARTVTVYTAPHQSTTLGEADTLSGDPVLPGFTLPLRDLFAELDRQGNG
jgi:Uma2 family endonuclease